MIEFTEITRINAPPPVVWNAIHDYTRRMKWDTMLRRVAVNRKTPEHAGPIKAGTEVTQWSRWRAGGVKMTACYRESSPPDSENEGVAVVEMIRGPWFFRSFQARAVLRRDEQNSTVCEATYTFDCRPNGLRWIVDRAVVWMFKRETTARWNSLRRYVEVSPRFVDPLTSSSHHSLVPRG